MAIDNELVNRLSRKDTRKTLKEYIQVDNADDTIEYLISELLYSNHCFISRANEEVSKGMFDLEMMDKWTNLNQIAQHAVESAIKVLGKTDSEMDQTMKLHMQAKLWFMTMNGQDRIRIYNQFKDEE